MQWQEDLALDCVPAPPNTGAAGVVVAARTGTPGRRGREGESGGGGGGGGGRGALGGGRGGVGGVGGGGSTLDLLQAEVEGTVSFLPQQESDERGVVCTGGVGGVGGGGGDGGDGGGRPPLAGGGGGDGMGGMGGMAGVGPRQGQRRTSSFGSDRSDVSIEASPSTSSIGGGDCGSEDGGGFVLL